MLINIHQQDKIYSKYLKSRLFNKKKLIYKFLEIKLLINSSVMEISLELTAINKVDYSLVVNPLLGLTKLQF